MHRIATIFFCILPVGWKRHLTGRPIAPDMLQVLRPSVTLKFNHFIQRLDGAH